MVQTSSLGGALLRIHSGHIISTSPYVPFSKSIKSADMHSVHSARTPTMKVAHVTRAQGRQRPRTTGSHLSLVNAVKLDQPRSSKGIWDASADDCRNDSLREIGEETKSPTVKQAAMHIARS
mmetsp:Transcript_17743/g.34334  ORF Transcript_17743/g.34334 Transcript_17743/m.34334 type:complete len:122 (+) Transcript_17743:114-479(+)